MLNWQPESWMDGLAFYIETATPVGAITNTGLLPLNDDVLRVK